MTYTGRVEKGVVVFDGPVRPADGVVVPDKEWSLTDCTSFLVMSDHSL